MAQGTYEAMLVEFLANKENLAYALEIAEHIGAVKDRLHQKFWRTLHACIKARLDPVPGWDLHLNTNAVELLQPDIWCLSLEPSSRPGKQILQPLISQSRDFRPYYGLCWGDVETPNPPDLAPIKALRSKLPDFKQSKWFLAWTQADFWLRTRQGCLALAEGDTPEERLASIIVDLFNDTRPLIEEANRALAGQ